MAHSSISFISNEISLKCIKAWKENKIILICGNGGSASQADHFVGESLGRFKKNRKALPAVNLSASIATTTCIANDFGYDNIFERQINGFKNNTGLVICLSTSGNSLNIRNAMNTARQHKIDNCLITGTKCDINQYDKIKNNIYIIESNITAKIQEETLKIIHLIFSNIDMEFY